MRAVGGAGYCGSTRLIRAAGQGSKGQGLGGGAQRTAVQRPEDARQERVRLVRARGGAHSAARERNLHDAAATTQSRNPDATTICQAQSFRVSFR